MRWKGRRQSTNVEDLRGSRSGRKIGMKGGIIGTLVLALIIWLLGGNPLEVLNLVGTGTEYAEAGIDTTPQQDEMTQFISTVLAETEDVWNQQFLAMGRTYREPTLVLFSGQVRSACGFSASATGPFYCPADEKVYIDLDFLQELQRRLGANGDCAIAYILAHEIGHHVQNLLGIMEQGNMGSDKDFLIRLELQADFLAGFWIHHQTRMDNIFQAGDLEEALNAATAVGDDRIQMKTQGYVVPDSFTHGTSEQRAHWLARGIETGDLKQGNTFNARSL